MTFNCQIELRVLKISDDLFLSSSGSKITLVLTNNIIHSRNRAYVHTCMYICLTLVPIWVNIGQMDYTCWFYLLGAKCYYFDLWPHCFRDIAMFNYATWISTGPRKVQFSSARSIAEHILGIQVSFWGYRSAAYFCFVYRYRYREWIRPIIIMLLFLLLRQTIVTYNHENVANKIVRWFKN